MIEWTEQASRQLDQIYEYITASKSEEVAVRIATQIVSRVEQLANFPLSGRPGRVRNTRELVISKTPYIAVYTIDDARIVVLAIYHGARRWPASF